MIALPIIPVDYIALVTELSSLLAASPPELRTVNLSDRFTFASGVDQDFDDGLGDIDLEDCTEVYGDEDAESEPFDV